MQSNLSNFLQFSIYPIYIYVKHTDIIWRATEGAGEVGITDVLPAHPEVGQLDVALAVQHHVVQLQVPVDDSLTGHVCYISHQYIHIIWTVRLCLITNKKKEV